MAGTDGRGTRGVTLSASLVGMLGVALSSALVLVIACTGPGPEDDFAGIEHMCSSCHGIDGRSISPIFPRLAGQQKNYIVAELKIFRDRSRAETKAHTYMWGMASRLTDPTIDRLAADYASQTPVPGTPGDPAEVEAGRKIFENGIVDKEVPACTRCHGMQAQGADTYPRLAGQHRLYLEGQLAVFASNERANKTMHQNARNLTDEQIHQLATYLAGL